MTRFASAVLATTALALGACAPLVNAMVSVTKEGLWSKTPPQFFAGLLLAAVGAGLVMYYKPSAGPAKKPDAAPAALTAPAKVAALPPVRAVARGYVDVTTRQYHVT